jgi:hypothetical protein
VKQDLLERLHIFEVKVTTDLHDGSVIATSDAYCQVHDCPWSLVGPPAAAAPGRHVHDPDAGR